MSSFSLCRSLNICLPWKERAPLYTQNIIYLSANIPPSQKTFNKFSLKWRRSQPMLSLLSPKTSRRRCDGCVSSFSLCHLKSQNNTRLLPCLAWGRLVWTCQILVLTSNVLKTCPLGFGRSEIVIKHATGERYGCLLVCSLDYPSKSSARFGNTCLYFWPLCPVKLYPPHLNTKAQITMAATPYCT